MHLNPSSDPKNFVAAEGHAEIPPLFPTFCVYRGVAVFVRVTSSRLHVSIWLVLWALTDRLLSTRSAWLGGTILVFKYTNVCLQIRSKNLCTVSD